MINDRASVHSIPRMALQGFVLVSLLFINIEGERTYADHRSLDQVPWSTAPPPLPIFPAKYLCMRFFSFATYSDKPRGVGLYFPKRKNLEVVYVKVSSFGIRASSFTFVNKCEYTVWPGILANAGTQALSTTGFELATGQSVTLAAPAGWAGRMWGRTACTFDSGGKGTCGTGDCGGSLECNGMGDAPPATLAEFTLGQASLQDFYDVSLVDGYNLPMLVTPHGGNGSCRTTGCIADLNLSCPKELQVDGIADGEGRAGSVACKSACNAFGNPEYCCSGAFGNPHTCKPSKYSLLFKTACPRSYTYAYDDATSTFTCSEADYTITFCPPISRQKKSKDSPSSAPDDNDTWEIFEAADGAATSGAGGSVRRVGFPRWLVLHASGTALWFFLATWQAVFVR